MQSKRTKTVRLTDHVNCKMASIFTAVVPVCLLSDTKRQIRSRSQGTCQQIVRACFHCASEWPNASLTTAPVDNSVEKFACTSQSVPQTSILYYFARSFAVRQTHELSSRMSAAMTSPPSNPAMRSSLLIYGCVTGLSTSCNACSDKIGAHERVE
jgi:hypothetical protein